MKQVETLTERQREVLDFILDFFQFQNRIPTSREVSKHFGWSSQTAGISHMRLIAKKGYLEHRGRFWRFNPEWEGRPHISIHYEKAKRQDEGEDESLPRPSKDGRSAAEVRRVRHAGNKNYTPKTPPVPPLRSKSFDL